MRPVTRFLGNELVENIVAEARSILGTLGVEIHNNAILSMLSDHGAKVDGEKNRVLLTGDMIDRSLETAPKGFKLYDVLGRETHDLSGYNVHFTPGSAAINILAHDTNKIRKPTTGDYVNYVKVVSQLHCPDLTHRNAPVAHVDPCLESVAPVELDRDDDASPEPRLVREPTG